MNREKRKQNKKQTLVFFMSFLLTSLTLFGFSMDANASVTHSSETQPIGGSFTVNEKTIPVGEVITYTITYRNQIQESVSGINFSVQFPEDVRFIQDGSVTMKQEGDAFVYIDEKLNPGEQKEFTLHAKVLKSITQKEFTTIMNIKYMNPATHKEVSDNASLTTTVSNRISGGSSGFLAGVTNMPFFPNSLVEWLILFLVLIIFALILRQIYGIFDEKKRQKVARTEADRHMQQMRERMSGNGHPVENMYGQPYGQNPIQPSYPSAQSTQAKVSYPAGMPQATEMPAGNSVQADHYGQSGFGPNGQPVYVPNLYKKDDQKETRNDRQGNGHTTQKAEEDFTKDYIDYRKPYGESAPETKKGEEVRKQAGNPGNMLVPAMMPQMPYPPFNPGDYSAYGIPPYGWPPMPQFPPMYGYGMYGWPMMPGMYPQGPVPGFDAGNQMNPNAPFMGGYQAGPAWAGNYPYPPQAQQGEKSQNRNDGFSNGNPTR